MTTSPPIVSVIGAGRMGRRHVNVVASHERATLDTVVDTSDETAREVAEEYDVNWSKDTEPVLKTSGACIIATPEDTHASLVEKAIKYDCNVLLEKPIANQLSDATKIVEIDESTSQTILVGHILRFDARYRYLKKCLENNRIGELQSINVRRAIPRRWTDSMPSSLHPLLQTGVHEIDIIRWLFGTDPMSIYADEYRDNDGKLNGVSTILSYENGLASLETSFIWPPDATTTMSSRIELFGTDGYVEAKLPDQSCSSSKTDLQPPDLLLWPTIDGRMMGSLRNQFDHFLDCLNGTEPVVPTIDAEKTLRVAHAILQSAEEGQKIPFDDSNH